MSPADEPYLQRGCPACGGKALDPAWQMASAPPADHAGFAELQDSWRGFFKDRKLFFTYRRCAECGQVYAPRYFTPDQLGALYRQMDDNTGGQPEALMVRTQRGYLDLLRAEAGDLPSGGYLELGPDIGLFTREALKTADFALCWMVEPNLAVHPALEELLRGREHTLLADAAEIARVPDGSLALVVAIHVLDHLLEPQPLLEMLFRKLRPGGAILAVTHHQGSLLARMFGCRWPAYCLQHPQLYASATLERSLERAGFGPVRVRATTNYFPVMYLLRHFLFAAGLGRVSLPEWPGWTVGLKLGNIAAIGRKPAAASG
jgi:SAM-dependent methyltransferase